MKLIDARAGDKVRVFPFDTGEWVYTEKGNAKIDAKVLYAAPDCVMLGWNAGEIPTGNAGYPKYAIDDLKQRGFIPKDWQCPASIVYVAGGPAATVADCELLSRKPTPEDFTKCLRDAEPGDRVEIPIDANGYIKSHLGDATASTPATVFAKDTDGEKLIVLAFQEGDFLPKLAGAQTHPSKCFGGFVGRISARDIGHIPCAIHLPDGRGEPRKEEPLQKEEPKSDPLKATPLASNIELGDLVSLNEWAYVVIGRQRSDGKLCLGRCAKVKDEYQRGHITSGRPESVDYVSDHLEYHWALFDEIKDESQIKLVQKNYHAGYIEGLKASNKAAEQAKAALSPIEPVKVEEAPAKPEPVPAAKAEAKTTTLGTAKLGDKVRWRGEEPTIVAICDINGVLLGWRNDQATIHGYPDCWAHWVPKSSPHIPNAETDFANYYSIGKEDACEIISSMPAAEVADLEPTEQIEPIAEAPTSNAFSAGLLMAAGAALGGFVSAMAKSPSVRVSEDIPGCYPEEVAEVVQNCQTT
jgi:hypothetical protein